MALILLSEFGNLFGLDRLVIVTCAPPGAEYCGAPAGVRLPLLPDYHLPDESLISSSRPPLIHVRRLRLRFQLFREPSTLRLRRRHLLQKLINLKRKFAFAVITKPLAHGAPTLLDFLARLEKIGLARLHPNTAGQEFIGDGIPLVLHMRRPPVQVRSINAIALTRHRHASDYPISCIGRNSLRPKMSRKLVPPLPQCRLADIQSPPLLARRLDDQMNMRVRLVCVQNHCIPMLQRELFARECPTGREQPPR